MVDTVMAKDTPLNCPPAIDMTSEHYTIVVEILHTILPDDVQVLAFGSRVKGVVKRASDLDIALKWNNRTIPVSIMADLHDGFSESDLPYGVDVVDMNGISAEFLYVVQSHAVPFFERS